MAPFTCRWSCAAADPPGVEVPGLPSFRRRTVGTGSRRSAPILLFLLALLLCSCSQGARCEGEVSQVTCHIWTGHVIPSWSEDYVISGTTVRLARTGEPGSEVNAGTWELDVDPQQVALLLAQLQAVDWASIEAIPPPNGPAPDGGASTSYKVQCANETGGSLWYREGWTYAGGENDRDSAQRGSGFRSI